MKRTTYNSEEEANRDGINSRILKFDDETAEKIFSMTLRERRQWMADRERATNRSICGIFRIGDRYYDIFTREGRAEFDAELAKNPKADVYATLDGVPDLNGEPSVSEAQYDAWVQKLHMLERLFPPPTIN